MKKRTEMSSDICDTCDRVHKVVLRKETECSSFRTLSLSLSFSAQQDKLPLSCFSSDVNKDGCCRVSTSQERCRLSLQIAGRYSSKSQGDIGITPGIQQFTRSMSFTSQLSKPKTAPSFSWYMSPPRLRNGLRCSQWPRNVDRLASSLHLENGETPHKSYQIVSHLTFSWWVQDQCNSWVLKNTHMIHSRSNCVQYLASRGSQTSSLRSMDHAWNNTDNRDYTMYINVKMKRVTLSC